MVGFVEPRDRDRCGGRLAGLDVHWIDDVGELAATHKVVCAIGSTGRSEIVGRVVDVGFAFATVVHPSAHVSRRSTVGVGSLVCPGVIVAAHSTIGCHVILNRGAMIGHHSTLGDFVSVMTGANIAGSCSVGERTFVGMGALVLNNLRVGSLSVVGAGALVTRDVPDRVKVMGSPARVVEEGVEGR